MLTEKSQADHSSGGVAKLTGIRKRAKKHYGHAMYAAVAPVEVTTTVSTGILPVVQCLRPSDLTFINWGGKLLV